MTQDKRRFKEDGERNTAVAEIEPEKFQLVPRGKWALVREMIQQESVTEGGIVQPGADFFMLAKKDSKHTYAVILELGAEVKPDLQKGDVVIVTKFSMKIEGVEQVVGDPNVKMVRDEEIYAIVRKCI
jgi:co-chaperonin GroES (HSP10)